MRVEGWKLEMENLELRNEEVCTHSEGMNESNGATVVLFLCRASFDPDFLMHRPGEFNGFPIASGIDLRIDKKLFGWCLLMASDIFIRTLYAMKRRGSERRHDLDSKLF